MMMDVLEENMIVVERLCRKYELTEKADWMLEFLTIYRRDKESFYNNLELNDFWGKLFCIGDSSSLSLKSTTIINNESLSDTELLQKSLVHIYEDMAYFGYHHSKIKQMVDTFKHWAEIKVYNKWKT